MDGSNKKVKNKIKQKHQYTHIYYRYAFLNITLTWQETTATTYTIQLCILIVMLQTIFSTHYSSFSAGTNNINIAGKTMQLF